jgi:hypothetical protein
MDRSARLLLGSLSHSLLTLAAATAMAGCNVYVPAQARTGIIATLRVSCEPQGITLNCRAIAQVADHPTDPQRETDVTSAVAWTTSNLKTANILGGHVTGNEPGTSVIEASMRSGDETVSSSVLVVVNDEHTCPQVAYDLKGVVRDLSNTGIANVELTLDGDQGHARTTMTRQVDGPSEGAFSFSAVLSGQYRLRAIKPGYRPVERLVNVPDTMPLTLVMLSEPR